MSEEHYFTTHPTSAASRRTVTVSLRGRAYRLTTAGGVFARRGLDPATRLLIETLDVRGGETVLDLGCGTGAVGIASATQAPGVRVVLLDRNARAVALARDNAAENHAATAWVVQGDATAPLRREAFDVVATNPPIRAGRAVVRRFIEGAREVLRPGGRFFLVARTAQGARTLGRLIAEIFGTSEEVARGSGCRVFRAVRADAGRRG